MQAPSLRLLASALLGLDDPESVLGGGRAVAGRIGRDEHDAVAAGPQGLASDPPGEGELVRSAASLAPEGPPHRVEDAARTPQAARQPLPARRAERPLTERTLELL